MSGSAVNSVSSRFERGAQCSVVVREKFWLAALFDIFPVNHFRLITDFERRDKSTFRASVGFWVDDKRPGYSDPDGLAAEVHSM